MKIASILITFCLFASCASKQIINESEIIINATSNTSVGNNYEMKITKIISDSRCPEGVNCVWAGEVQLVLAIYKNNVLEKEETVTINYKKLEYNKRFFTSYITSEKKIKDLIVLPAKKQEQTIDLKDYILKIEME